MADDDTERIYKEMASSKQGVHKNQPTPGTGVGLDHRHPGAYKQQSSSAAEVGLDQRHPQQPQQQQPPVRPSRSRHHSSRREPSTASSTGVIALPAGSRGPRSLYLRRDGDSFGFTLRHFIVYPPDSIAASDGRHAAVGALREPMETIFVKQVYENSPAHKAGLHHGDRLVSVNGYSLNGKSYAQVVQLIQNSPPYLHLLVVPKEDDVLQKFFPETAHNPETNQRPKRYASPESFSPRRQQNTELLKYRPIVYPTTAQQQPNRARASDTVSWRSYEEPTYGYTEHRNSLYQPVPNPRATGIQYDTRGTKSSEQLYSVPKDNLVYRSIQNPRAAPQHNRNSLRDSLEGSGGGGSSGSNIYAEPYVHDLSQRPRAQPQVPSHNYHRGKMGRRASEGSNISDNSREVSYDSSSGGEYPDCTSLVSSDSAAALSDMVVNSSKMKSASKVAAYPHAGHHVMSGATHPDTHHHHHQQLHHHPHHHSQTVSAYNTGADGTGVVVPCGLSYVNSAGCRLSLDDGRRESSASLNSSVADGSKDSLSSYDSTSTLTGQDTDDSIIMTRFRKSFEKKEEFLRRPSEPTGWKNPDDCAKPNSATVIQREFYGRPQKLQKEWPPNEPSLNGQESPSKNSMKPTHQNFQRVKIDIDSERDYMVPQNGKDASRNDMQIARNNFYREATGQPAQFVVGGLVSVPLQRNSNIRQSKDKNSFVTTLSRIHESAAPAVENGDEAMMYNGSISLPNAAMMHDSMHTQDERRYPVPPNLQIVSRRTRQFESGRPLPEEEDGSLSDRTNFYRSELSRLSSKRVVPNVAVRKREFETLEIENNKDYRRDRDMGRRPTQRESRSLDNSGIYSNTENSSSFSGNRVIPIGSKHLHCTPPADYKLSDVLFENDTPHVQLRARSNSAESWSAAMQQTANNSNSHRHTTDWLPPMSVSTDDSHRSKVGRQDSYVSALKSKVPDQDHNKQSSVFVEQEDMDIGPQTTESIVPTTLLIPAPKASLIPESVVRMNTATTTTTPSHTAPVVVSVTPATPPTTVTKPAVIRPNQLNITSPMRPATCLVHTEDTFGDVSATRRSASPVPGDTPPQVVRRSKNNTNSLGEEDRATRRVSYLKATWNDRMHVESDLDTSDTEVSPQVLRSRYRRWKPPKFPKDIKPIRLLFEEAGATIGRNGSADGPASLSLTRSETPTSPERETAPVNREGALSCKFMELEGKRANDRSWHKVWAVLKGPHLFLYKDRHHHHQSPMGLVDTDQQLPGGVDMRYSVVNVADDYTKRKNVLRISAAYPYRTELLLQADSPVEMADWVRTLQEQNGASTEEEKQECISENKQAQPQQIPAATSIQVQGTARLSPQPSNKSKLTTFRNRSPTGQSPKSKTWRGRVVKQFKKLNQGSGSPSSPTTPEKLTFGVPLEHCQRSIQNEFVPRFVEMCTDIIEERGLDVIGIYRVPGNNAAVSALTEELNKGINLALQDVRSSDTNVVSSLLKSFFRKLPDSLLTSDLYHHFIDADKIEDPLKRLIEIKKLLNELPDHQYATLKHLILHLKKVVDNCEINKMEARNLAIVFGPTLVRNVEDNMVTMVTDMSHQCRIVESLLLYAEWFFSEDDAESLNLNSNIAHDVASIEMDNTSATVNNTLLLSNISKIEGIKTESNAREKKDLVSSLLSAANRKIQKKSRKMAADNTSITKEEVTTPTNESKEAGLVPLIPQADEQKQTSLDSEESSGSDNVIPDDPLLMTYPQLQTKTSERVERFRQETMAMLQQPKRRSDPTRSYTSIKPYLQNGDQTDSSDNQTSSDLLATITSAFDNKIKALQSPTNNGLTVSDNIPYADESPDVTFNSFDTTIVEGAKMFNSSKESQKCDQDADKMSPKSFRNPSLHKNFNSSSLSSSNLGTTKKSNSVMLKNLHKTSSYDADHKEKDVDENENSDTKSRCAGEKNSDELNELCKINFNSFIMNKELKCSASDSKLKRSESLNKSDNRDSEQEHGKLKRSVSLNRAGDRLKRSDSLTKYEKTESNINLRRELADDTNRRLKKVSTKLKRKNGMPERSIKRRHTVGGTKDFDRVHWLDNRLRYEAEESANEDSEKIAMRSSSPDLSYGEKIINNVSEESKLPLESHI